MTQVSGVEGKVSVLINSGINDDSLPATMNTYAHLESALLPQTEGCMRTKASYFDPVCTGDCFDLSVRQHSCSRRVLESRDSPRDAKLFLLPKQVLRLKRCYGARKSCYIPEDSPQQLSQGARLRISPDRDS